MTDYENEQVDLKCVDCGDVFGQARLSGDKRAVHQNDDGSVYVGGWEYGGTVDPVCPACHLAPRLRERAERLSEQGGGLIDVRALADEWDVDEDYAVEAVHRLTEERVLDWGVSPMVPFVHPEFNP